MNTSRMKELIQQLNEASEAYYKYDNPLMTDKAYDALYDELESLEQETGIILAGSPTQKVQGFLLKGFKEVQHSTPMLSAAKTKDINEIKKFLCNKVWYCSGKLDGCTLVLRYSNGEFLQGITRGNGIIGEDVTDACRFIRNIPMQIPFKDDLEVRGECVISWKEFNRINSKLGNKYSHPRNLASGTLRQLDLNIVKDRKLSFIAFECVTNIYDNKYKELEWLINNGFETVIRMNPTDSSEDVEKTSKVMTELIEEDEYPYDGLIFEINSKSISEKLGSTTHHRNCRIAQKWMDNVYETVFRDIEWNPGKTGVLFPTGIVDPVDLDGAITSRVTLHNISYIKELELGIGDIVTLYRSNMVIPAIDNNLTRSNNIIIPDTCPICGGKTEIRKDNESEVLYCTNPDCEGKLLGRLTHFVSKKGMDIDGLSEQTLSDLINLGMIRCFEDIFNLSRYADHLKKIPGYGNKSVNNLLNAIEKSRNTTDLQHFITAISIPGIGEAQSKIICKEFDSWEQFWLAACGYYNFTKLDGIGNVLNNNIHNFANNNHNIDNLAKYINFANNNNNNVSIRNNNISEKTFVITGTVNHFKNRDELKEKIENLGGKVVGSVSKNTDYLINNDSTSNSSKNTKAKQLGVPIITEEEFISLVNENNITC